MLLEIPISPNDAGQRAERFLRRYLPHVGMSRLQSLFRRKEIKIAKKPIERGYMLQPGETLQVYGIKPEESERPVEKQAWPAGDPIPAVFEDDELMVVNKPAGVASHPGTGIAPGASLIERVHAQLGETEEWSGELFSPSLVHRLDKETSGLLLVAKTGQRLRSLVADLREGKIRKRYLALVVGHPNPPAATIDAPLARDDNPSGAKSRVADEEEGSAALTRYKTVRKVGDYALLQVIIETGRMHQIRAHLAHIGHPIVGDTRYDKPGAARQHLKDLGLKRLFLHAEELSWEENGKTRSFQAALPDDLRAALNMLEGK